jgi:VWFA-related protein
MRVAEVLTIGAAIALAVVPVCAQDVQTPVFRSGVDLLEVDVNIVDGGGRPIPDLRTLDFTVTVDGQPRKVVTSEFIRDDSSQNPAAAFKVDPYVATNTDRPRGRLIIIVIDQNNITSGRARDLVTSVSRFVDGLASADRIALVAIPAPGPAVEFTTNRQAIHEAVRGIRGTDDRNISRYDVGDYEAIALVNRGDEMVIRRVIDRECVGGEVSCISDLELEASRIVQRIRTQSGESYYSMTILLNNLRDAEGTKSMVLLSQGWILDDVQSKAATLAALAADARVNLNVVLLDETLGEASTSRRSFSAREDRELREQGLEAIAARSRGGLFPVTSSAEIAFERLSLELSGHYLLGVEPTERDRDGKTHQIRVQVKRRGSTVRARREFQYTSRADTRPREARLTSLLRSPSTATDLPMRLASYVFQDPESSKEKLLIATEIDPSARGPVDLMLGFVLFNSQGRAVNSGSERKIFTLAGAHSVEYDLALTVEPGSYRLRFAAIDGAGNRGSLEHDVRVWQMAGDKVVVGDLMLGRAGPGSGRALRPVVNTRIDNGQLAVYTEFYSNRPETLEEVDVVMEIAAEETGPALMREEGIVMPRAEGAGRQASALMHVGELETGRYFARAVVSARGQVVGRTVRPFTIAKQ